jgi:hypothetical protein
MHSRIETANRAVATRASDKRQVSRGSTRYSREKIVVSAALSRDRAIGEPVSTLLLLG